MKKKIEIGASINGISTEGMTQREVADVLGVSRSYVAQTEEKAVNKLRRALNARLKGASIKTILPD